MTKGYIITGTDTGIGKTVFSAMLTLALKGTYWKPVQSGTVGGTDTQIVKKLTGLSEEHFLPETYIFSQPLSPHRAAELDDVSIKVEALTNIFDVRHEPEFYKIRANMSAARTSRPPEQPAFPLPLIIEGAGGLKVPLTRDTLLIDLFKEWDLPVILCARTGLGTINHTLLSIEALNNRNIPIHGVAFIGDENEDNIRTIAEFSGVKVLGRMPLLEKLEKGPLEKVFTRNFII